MSYKPCSEERRKHLEDLIAAKKKHIALDQSCIDSSEQELVRGEWVYDLDFSTLPKPKPHCYLCARATAIHTCSLGYTYGVVCPEYVHIHDAIEP